MLSVKTDLFGIAALLAVACLTGCSASGSAPARLLPSQKPAVAGDSGTAFSVTVRTEHDAAAASASAAKPQVMNGSQVEVVVTGARDATSGYADAGGNRVSLVRSSDDTWRGSFQYIDESNPPPKDPAIDVGLQFPVGEAQVRRIPIVEMHD